MKIALVHDFLAHEGGAEKVVEAFHGIWPEAPLFVLFHDRARASKVFLNYDVRTSYLQRVPGAVRHYRWFLPFMPSATESYDLRDFDVILSSSSAFAKGILARPGALHICYCHTPTRYLWTDTHAYVSELSAPLVAKRFLPPILTFLRMWDKQAADRVDHFIANSQTVAERIKTFYRRDSLVINPPVPVSSFEIGRGTGGYYLIGGRLVSYKRFDIVIRAFNQLGFPLKIFGIGPEYAKLRAIAKKNIEFLGAVSEDDKRRWYRDAIAFLHPHVEDFGITAIEAMASGRPVIAFPAGGIRESMIPGITGTFFEEQTWESLASTMLRFRPQDYAPERIREVASQFDTKFFQARMKQYVEDKYREHQGAAPESQMKLGYSNYHLPITSYYDHAHRH